MMFLKHIFEILPVVLACFSAVTCSIRYSTDRRKHDRIAMILATVCSVMLIVAQTSWWTTSLVEHSLQGTVFANAIWTLFNSLTMLTFIVIAKTRRKNERP